MALTMEKLSKVFVIRLHREFIQFLVSKERGVGLQAFAKLENTTLFEDHLIESLNRGEIWLEITGEHLSRTLKCANSSATQSVTMKLTKKMNLPVLCFTINTKVCLLVWGRNEIRWQGKVFEMPRVDAKQNQVRVGTNATRFVDFADN
ncbi:hypothetical protein HDU98_002597 [Podochytrium sp. JEL0797]|nr:hypothetical protein HDU98_002597 [Podochytrium sp. JEL0797]